MRRALLALALALVPAWLAAGPAQAAGTTITGASQATCANPSPCQSPSGYTTVTLPAVSDDAGGVSSRQFAVIRPRGLAPSLTNLAPAVLVFYASGACGYRGAGLWPSLAAANRFVVVAMEVPCPRTDWQKRNVSDTGLSVPDDEPYVTAVVQSLEQCPLVGATAAECIDPQRVYAVGESSGGNMVADVMCDVANSSLFRGYLIDSSSLQVFGGMPNCPSTNRSYFVMMALGNYGPDRSLYYDTTPNAHLDVRAFADWEAQRLGCTASRVNGAVGSPSKSTITYTYTAPCAYATSGAAIQTLGVINGAHGWNCQDSNPGTPANPCPAMPNPPGLGTNGWPLTNGLSIENTFWSMMAHGASSDVPAPPLADPNIPAPAPTFTWPVSPPVTTTGPSSGPSSGPSPGTSPSPAQLSLQAPVNGSTVSGPVSLGALPVSGAVSAVQVALDNRVVGTAVPGAGGSYSYSWDSSKTSDGVHTLSVLARNGAGQWVLIGSRTVMVADPLSRVAGAQLEALGDGFAAGLGAPPYLGTGIAGGGTCPRSAGAYPFLGARTLDIPASQFGFHACSGATVADFTHADAGSRAPAQLRWLAPSTRLVTLTVGWQDSRIPAALRACALAPRKCLPAWHPALSHALARLAGKRSSAGSLAALFARVRARAPHARVLVLGYPALFAATQRGACPLGAGAPLSATTASSIDAAVAGLDRALARAAALSHLTYVRGSYGAFSGHELCSGSPDLNGAVRAGRHSLSPASFMPNAVGQLVLAKLLAAAM